MILHRKPSPRFFSVPKTGRRLWGTCVAAPLLALIAGQLSSPTPALVLPIGLPPITQRQDLGQVALGKRLFFDRRLSFNNTLSCGMCHIESQAFASTQTATAVGFEGKSLRRNAPSLLNVAFQKTLFHDGRESDLVHQVWLPLLAADEMANPSIGYVLTRVQSLKDYNGEFERVFAGKGASVETVGEAIAAYERTLFSGNSRFDKWYFGDGAGALTEQEKRGFGLFVGKANCATCHKIEGNFALFTDQEFHDTGIGYRATMDGGAKSYRVQMAPGFSTNIHSDDLRSVTEPRKNDLGRFEVTLRPEDRWAYKTPSLRNVAQTAPYMHDGSLVTLEEVVNYYDAGGVPHAGLADKIKPLALTSQEKADVVAFLKSLNGEPAPSTGANSDASNYMPGE